MAVPTTQKNLWIAASDGELERVRVRMSPNAPDPNTYTPMHAAASYGHIELLEYLISRGGDVNVTDEDGDTPIYTVESVQVAQWLVDHGAMVDRRNNEGVSPIEHLEEEFPEVSAHLRSTLTASNPTNASSQTSNIAPASQLPSEHATEVASERLTADLLASVRELASASAVNPDGTTREPTEEEIRAAVERVVLQGVVTGHEMGRAAASSNETDVGSNGGTSLGPRRSEGGSGRPEEKRPRKDD
ncbi:ankyrin [Clavulina sp. PMI_390]|nr:ankyrin [Clavulina sp. PMI_390]